MVIHCKLCHFAIKPLGPLQVTESEQVMELMAEHLVARHPREAASLKQDLMLLGLLLSPYLMIQRYVTIPEGETALRETVDKAESALMELFAPETKTAS
jgi:hypothetical protein